MTERIGIIGLGLLGSAIARRLLSGGFEVVGFDINRDRLAELQSTGGVPVSSAPEAVANVRTVLFSLPRSCDSRTVIDQVAPNLEPGTIVLDTTTGTPQEIETISSDMARLGVHYVDANICGSSAQAERGEVLCLLGAPEELLSPCLDVLKRLSREQFYLHRAGAATRMKLVFNLVLGLHRAVLAEGLGLAADLGLNLDQTLNVLQAGSAASEVMCHKGRKMLEKDFAPQAKLSQHLKDVELMLEATSNARLPLTTTHRMMLQQLVEFGHGAEDNAAISRWYLSDY